MKIYIYLFLFFVVLVLWFALFCLSGQCHRRALVDTVLTSSNVSVEASSVYPSTGLASWYSGIFTASGERFQDNAFTCAMHRKDFGRYYSVCNIENGKCVLVRQNDFGPSEEFYRQGRIVDLTRKAFNQISDTQEGVIKVVIKEAADSSAK